MFTSTISDFTAKWEGYFEFENEEYTFHKDSDDGMTVWVDMDDDEKFESDEKIFDDDVGKKEKKKTISYGAHLVKVQYREESKEALAKLHWTRPNQFAGWYYLNVSRNFVFNLQIIVKQGFTSSHLHKSRY